MGNYLIVGAGGFIGAAARYGATVWVQSHFASKLPIATFGVNIIGCFLIGIVMALAMDLQSISPTTRLFLATGCLGGLTTFSTFSYETLELAQTNRMGLAAAYICASVTLGLLAAMAGRGIVRLWA